MKTDMESLEIRYGNFDILARQKLKINMTDLQSWTTDKDMNTYMYLNYSRKEHTAGNLAFDLEGVQSWRKKL